MGHLKRCSQIPYSWLLTESVRVAQLALLRLMRLITNINILPEYYVKL